MMTRRRVSGLVLVAVLVVGVLAAVGGATAQPATTPDCATVVYETDGSGAVEVGSVEQLQCLGNDSTNTNVSDDFVQVADIDASATAEWDDGAGFDPIGGLQGPHRFTGTYDGQGHAIENLTVDRPNENRIGLFEYIWDGATIRNVTLTNATVAGDTRTGGIVGYVEGGTVANSTVSGTVTGGSSVGGLVGVLFNVEESPTQDPIWSEVAGAHARGNVTASDGRVGGLVGLNRGSVRDSYATARVTGNDDNPTGGLVGINGFEATISNAYAAGPVFGGEAGGVVGQTGDTLADAYWDVDVTGQQNATNIGSTGDTVAGRTTAELRGDSARNATTLDFASTWTVRDERQSGTRTVSYPFLVDNPQTPPPGLDSWQLRALSDLAVADEGASARIPVGSNESVAVNVTNTDTRAADVDVTLAIDERVTVTKTVTDVLPNATTRVTFQNATGSLDVGSYGVTVSSGNATASGNVTVTDLLFVDSYQPRTAAVVLDGTLTVDVTVRNVDSVERSATVPLVAENATVDTAALTLAAESTTTVPLAWDPFGVDWQPSSVDAQLSVVDLPPTTVSVVGPDVNDNGSPATDTTGDVRLEDLTGDGETDVFDVQLLFASLDSTLLETYPELFDFDGSGSGPVSVFDVQALFAAVE